MTKDLGFHLDTDILEIATTLPILYVFETRMALATEVQSFYPGKFQSLGIQAIFNEDNGFVKW